MGNRGLGIRSRLSSELEEFISQVPIFSVMAGQALPFGSELLVGLVLGPGATELSPHGLVPAAQLRKGAWTGTEVQAAPGLPLTKGLNWLNSG